MQKILKSHKPINNIRISSTLKIVKSQIYISFTLTGALDSYIFPHEQRLERVDELWKSTCFELFLANSNEEEYYELNISPSLGWNFYHLKKYRAEVEEVELLSEATINVIKEGGNYKIEFKLEGFDFEKSNIYNITAILLTKEGERTFWSLKPMDGTPDFHNQMYFCEF